MSGLSENVRKQWIAQKKEWIKICNLNQPNSKVLAELISNWPNFRHVTLELASNKSVLTGNGVHKDDAKACLNDLQKFFGIQQPEELPVARNLTRSLELSPTKLENYPQSRLKVELFTCEWKECISTAQKINVDIKKREEESLIQKKSAIEAIRSERDPFFSGLKTIVGKLEEEKKSLENRYEGTTHRSELLGQLQEKVSLVISNTKSLCIADYNSDSKGSGQTDLRKKCKKDLIDVINSPEFKELQTHQIPGTLLGRYLYNAIMALPVKLCKIFSNKPINSLFYSTKTLTKESLDEIKENINILGV